MGEDVPRSSALFTASDLYAPPQHVDPHTRRGEPQKPSSALGGRSMHDSAFELLRTPLPRTSVNKGKKDG